MLYKNRISNSFNHKKKKVRKRNLTSWINDYEIQAYATEEMKKEIKELLFDVYDNDKDIKDIKEHFYTKYVNIFSDSINEKSNPKDIDSLYKKDIPFASSEKNEFKQFIENRNKVLKEKEQKKHFCKNYSDFWSENKKTKNALFDFNDDEYEKAIKKRNKSNKDYIDDRKRNNSKVRDYAKNRYQVMNKYMDFFSSDNNNYKNSVSKENKKTIKKEYYYNDKDKEKDKNINNNKTNKKRCINKTPSFLNFHNYNTNKNTIHNDIKIRKCMNNNITRLLINKNNKQKEKNEIKVHSRKNKYINREEKPNNNNNNNRYNINNNNYNNNNNNNDNDHIGFNKEIKSHENGIDTKYINEFIIHDNDNKNNLINTQDYKDYKIKINDYKDDSSSSKSINKYTKEFLGDNNDEIKKIKVNGVKYIITGEPKKEEINEEIILDQTNIKNEKNEPGKESSLIHRKLIIKKNIEDKENDVSLVQKIEKDIKESNIRVSNFPKESLQKFLEDNEKNTKNSYKIIYYKENEIFGMNPFSEIDIDKEINKYKNNNSSYNTINTHKSYNERRRERKNQNDKKMEKKNNYFRDDHKYKEIKVNEKENLNNFNNYKYNNNRVYKSDIIEKKENKNEDLKEGINQYKNNLINNSSSMFGNKRKRFHRLINFSDK